MDLRRNQLQNLEDIYNIIHYDFKYVICEDYGSIQVINIVFEFRKNQNIFYDICISNK